MKKLFKNPLTMLVVGLVLVAGSSVGATRAALSYSDSAEEVSFETKKLLVDLVENQNGAQVSVAVSNSDSNQSSTVGKLSFTNLTRQITDENPLQVNHPYDEDVFVQNTSTDKAYSEYVRVLVRKSWIKNDGSKDTRLDPSVITLKTTEDWFIDENESTAEGTVYYCKKPVAVDEQVQFLDAISFEREILDGVTTTKVNENGTVVENVYGYDGKTFEIEIRVDAVQTHSGAEAILGAWGVEATIDSDGNITSINSSN
ncbi:hypothetical protein [Pseudobutyrivibrio sp. LB2011]|uniref:hypothetical protein n=1 Tax=Pseudobutyrivibrio sp. LB2011 TaxID=1408312 RepID=UPI0005D1CA1C|nr:hypothetical protein [Pseudobutyrivibrio sp. LB2011]